MEISICAATGPELAPSKAMASILEASGHRLRFFTTGVGMLQSSFYIQQHIHQFRPELLLQIGIAGSFDPALSPGSVVLVEKEYLGSLGVEENTAGFQQHWKDIFDLGLQAPSEAPFIEKALVNPCLDRWPWIKQMRLQTGTGVTIDEISTSPARIQALKTLYRPTVESMEGAALHFNALMHQTAFLQIRGISNLIGERDKSKWKIGPALQAVTETVAVFLKQLSIC